jgi:hypothetical protein
MSTSLQFLRRGPISPRLHGTLDYPLAAVLIAGPLVLNFDDDTAKCSVAWKSRLGMPPASDATADRLKASDR